MQFQNIVQAMWNIRNSKNGKENEKSLGSARMRVSWKDIEKVEIHWISQESVFIILFYCWMQFMMHVTHAKKKKVSSQHETFYIHSNFSDLNFAPFLFSSLAFVISFLFKFISLLLFIFNSYFKRKECDRIDLVTENVFFLIWFRIFSPDTWWAFSGISYAWCCNQHGFVDQSAHFPRYLSIIFSLKPCARVFST